MLASVVSVDSGQTIDTIVWCVHSSRDVWLCSIRRIVWNETHRLTALLLVCIVVSSCHVSGQAVTISLPYSEQWKWFGSRFRVNWTQTTRTFHRRRRLVLVAPGGRVRVVSALRSLSGRSATLRAAAARHIVCVTCVIRVMRVMCVGRPREACDTPGQQIRRARHLRRRLLPSTPDIGYLICDRWARITLKAAKSGDRDVDETGALWWTSRSDLRERGGGGALLARWGVQE